MVLTHTLTPIEEQMPYHGLRMSPCRPLLFVGRSAKKQPQAPPRHCMYMFYREYRLFLESCWLEATGWSETSLFDVV